MYVSKIKKITMLTNESKETTPEMSLEEAAKEFSTDHPKMDSWSSFISGAEYMAQQKQQEFMKLVEGEIALQEHGHSVDNQYTVDVLRNLLNQIKK